jgi:hypothetical protein
MFGLICVSFVIVQTLSIGNLIVPLFVIDSVSNRGPLVLAAFTPFATIVFYFAIRHWFKVLTRSLIAFCRISVDTLRKTSQSTRMEI